MSKFIKLTSKVFNIANIKNIEILKNKYKISLTTTNKNGFMLFSFGHLSEINEYYVMNSNNDYNMISKYINEEPFIKLSNIAINKNHICDISISHDEYKIYYKKNHVNGFMLFGFGSIDTIDTYLKIEAYKNPDDYKIITDWLNKN